MKTFNIKAICNTLILLLIVLFCQFASANNHGVRKETALTGYNDGRADTSKTQKKSQVVTASKKMEREKEPEDGVDEDILARAKQEFLRTKDPALNIVPVRRLIDARKQKDQIMMRQGNTPPSLNNFNGGSLTGSLPSISTIQWTERGPNNVGGRTRALMFDLNDAANGYKKVFAGGVEGGLWVTHDITATPIIWNKINDFFENIAISCIAQDPSNPSIIYAGTGEGFYNIDATQGLGVWKSTNGGATWTMLASTASFKFINGILVDKNGTVYLAGLGFGVQRSSNGGTSWKTVIGSPNSNGADLELAANGDVYVTTGIFSAGKIFVSGFAANGANTGNSGTWVNITPNTAGTITTGTTAWWRIKLACAPGNADVVYALFEGTNGYSLTSLQQYSKSANTWTVKAVPPGSSFSNGQAWYSIAAAVDPNNSSVLFAGSLDAVKSVNGGSTWTPISEWTPGEISGLAAGQYVHADHHTYVFPPGSSSRLMMGTDGGVFYTANANATATKPTFIMQDHGYNVTQFYSVALHPTNVNYFLAGAQDNGTQQFAAAGLNATAEATGGDGGDTFIDQTNGNIQITSYTASNFSVSTNNGASFSLITNDGNGPFINPADYDNTHKSLYAGYTAGHYLRVNNISTTNTKGIVSVAGFGGAIVTAVNVSPKISNRVYFGLSNGRVARVDNANVGTNNASVILNPNASVSASVSCIAIDTASEDHLLVSYYNYGVVSIFETHNATNATPVWTAVEGNLPDMPVRWAMFYPGDVTKAIIATELGVWTTDALNGTSTVWNPSNSGLANVRVDMLKFRASDRTLAAATHGRGMFTTTLPSASAPAVPTLAGLTVSVGTLTPAFSSTTNGYTVSVPTATTIKMTPTATDATSIITVNGTTVASGNPSQAINLSPGANAISIVVTAADGVTTDTYTVNVGRGANNCNLSALRLSSGTLSPTFAGATVVSYSASVANSVASITVTPTTAQSTSTVKVNGTAVTSGTASGGIPLNVGVNTISATVTAQDGVTIKTYTVTVTRAGSANANLSALHLSNGVLAPAFAGATTTNYTASVANSISSITVTPTTAQATSTVAVDGTGVASGSASGSIPLGVGANTVNVTVTAEDGVTTKTYIVTVTRTGSNNDNLSGLHLSTGTLSPAFAGATTTSYTASVASTVSSITVTPTTAQTTSTVTVDGMAVTSGTASAAIALSTGANAVTAVVTAQDGVTTKTYTVTVTRASGPSTVPEEQVSIANQGQGPLLAGDGIVVHPGVSPNSDGVGDVLHIDGITQYPDNKLIIIDRNGALVYEEKGYNNKTKAFDGHSNKSGGMQEPGTYFYSLDYVVKGITKHKTGFIVLKY